MSEERVTTVLARPYAKGVLALVSLAALAMLVYAPLLQPGAVPYAPYSDVLPSHLATKGLLAHALAEGELPLWRRDLMLGAPALSDPQALYAHPLQLLFALVPPLHAFGPTYVLELWVAALGAFALARVLGCSLASSLLAGTAQLVSFKLIVAIYAGWSSVMPTLCLLPGLAAAQLAVAQRATPRATLALALCFALTLSGGTPQTPYYLGLALAPYLLVAARMRGDANGLGRHLAASTSATLLALTLGVAATAYLWVPLVTDLPRLARGAQDYAFFLSGHALTPSNLLTTLHPELFGTPLDGSYPGAELWEDVAYFGVLPLSGALCGLGLALRHGASSALRYLGLAFIVTALLSIDSPLLRAAYALVPGYAVFRMPGRIAFVSAVLGVALMALAFDALLAKRTPRTRLSLALALGLAMVLEGGFYARRYLAVVPASQLVPVAEHPARALDGAERVAVVGRSTLNYGWAEGLQLRLLNGYNPYSFASYKRYMDLTEHGSYRGVPLSNWFDLRRVARPDLLREASVSHVLAQAPLAWPGLELVAQRAAVPSFVFYKGFAARDLYVYRLQQTRPFARFATRVEPVATLDAMADRMQAAPLEGQAFVLAASGLPASERSGRGEAAVVRLARFGRFELETHSAQAGLLVIAEAFHPGFSATLDGAATPIVQANLALQGVWVPAGSHRIALRFAPRGFAFTAPLAVATWSLLVLAVVALTLRKRTAERA